jgi:hypothetical protein
MFLFCELILLSGMRTLQKLLIFFSDRNLAVSARFMKPLSFPDRFQFLFYFLLLKGSLLLFGFCFEI